MTENLIYESDRSKIFLVHDEVDGGSKLVKVLNVDHPTPEIISRFHNEGEVLTGIEIPGIRNVLARKKMQNKYALELEYFDGKRFKDAFKDKQNDILDFLFIAIEIAKILGNIHAKKIIHKDLNPSNILVNLQNRKVQIIDFELSTTIQSKSFDLSNPVNLQGTLAYCSPEQTGRMNRGIDHRTDLYSLGITFYEILTGRPPFISTDPMELVHAHISIEPDPPKELNVNIPAVISEIITKLIEKNAEDRYQTALGLQHDLEICLKQYQATKKIEKFSIGKEDLIGVLKIPQKLYGRDKEKKIIIEKFDACAAGACQLLLVAGYSGTGKTALVHEVHRPITMNYGYYAEGKFDQFNKSTPYFAILQALTALIDLILLEEDSRLKSISSQILKAVDEEGKVLTNLIPNLEHLIGPQPEIPQLGGEESKHRFTYLIQKFFIALCTPEHPIVLFIDDLQWADAASLHLLQSLISLPEARYLLCIGAYRDNEVETGHPLLSFIQSLQSGGVDIETLTLGNLLHKDISALIGDMVHKGAENVHVDELASLIIQKTDGNAFFTTQFLTSLLDRNLIEFDYGNKEWVWNIQNIKAENITENVVELMAEKLLDLRPSTQESVKLAACLGNLMDRSMLATIVESSSETLDKQLKSVFEGGFIYPVGTTQLKFAHDRIQQAAYSLIDEDKRANVHLKIASQLNQSAKNSGDKQSLFDIVNHYNSATDLIKAKGSDEKLRIAQLNVDAAARAKENSAYPVSLDYLQQALDLLPDNPWVQAYELTNTIYRELTESSYLCAQFELTEKYFHEINQHAQKNMDRVRAYEVHINAFKAKNELPRAIDTGIEALALLGKKLPRKPNKAQVLVGLLITELRMVNMTNEKVLNLPVMEDSKHEAAMRIMANIAPSAYWCEPNLIPMLAFEMIRMSIRHGISEVSAFCFSGYGIIMCGVLGAMRKGERYGDLGLELLKKFDSKQWITQIVDPVYALILHWNKHVKHSLKPLRDSFYTGLETGENEFACVNANIYCTQSLLSGVPLDGLVKETETFSQSFKRLEQNTQFNYNEISRQAMLCFMGLEENPIELNGAAIDSEALLSLQKERQDEAAKFLIYFNRMLLMHYFNEYKGAFENAQLANEYMEAVLSRFEIPNLYFYRALASISMTHKVKDKSDAPYKRIANKCLKKLSYFAKYAPENYLHKCLAIRAAKANASGNFSNARLLYDQAIKEANKQGFLSEEAMIYEMAGDAYQERGYNDLAQHYINQAYTLYQEWGAGAKLNHLSEKYPKLITAIQQVKVSNDQAGKNVTGFYNAGSLDMNTLLKASLSISSEVELPSLITKLLDVVIENAGAQKAVLILESDGELFIEGVKDLIDHEDSTLDHIMADGSAGIPASVIAYVQRTKKHIVTDTFESNTSFHKDDYIAKFKPESILSLPIINQGKFVGILYLENRVSNNVFTDDRINLLQVLSSQIAVSVENAQLYKNLEQKVVERTLELAEEKKKSDLLLSNILPGAVARELKEHGKTEPRHYEAVTVLFADFVGFTRAAQSMSARTLVNTLDNCFKSFDHIVETHGLEKIKTIGDAYMCAGGLPVPNSTHTWDSVAAAFDMVNAMKEFNEKQAEEGTPILDVRIGIHTGPLVAGVVGTKKFAYDIWGNTVNKASRLESNGAPGKINVSEEVYQLIKNDYACTLRGSIMAKNLGEISMYFIDNKIAT